MKTVSYAHVIKARKQHICDFCGQRILIGEKYMKATYVDSEIYDWKSHIYCDKLSHTLKMYDDCDDGVTAEYFQEYVIVKHIAILTDQIPAEDARKYGDIISQLMKVKFRDKLWFVIRHCNKLQDELKELI